MALYVKLISVLKYFHRYECMRILMHISRNIDYITYMDLLKFVIYSRDYIVSSIVKVWSICWWQTILIEFLVSLL